MSIQPPRSWSSLTVTLCLGVASLTSASAARGHEPRSAVWVAQDAARKESPFDGLRWVTDRPEVRVGDVWYRPVSIEGVAVEEILGFCERRWPGKAQKRFGEDLVEALEGMGHTLPRAVRLEVVRLADGAALVLEGVPSTRAKRMALLSGSSDAGPRPSVPPRRVTRAVALSDLEVFRAHLVDQFSYLERHDLALDATLEELGASLAEEVDVALLASRLRELLMRSGDGHASVTSAHDPDVARFTPFLLEEVEGGVVAVRPDRGGFVDSARPFVRAIDGHTLEEWVAALRPTIAAGSPQLVRLRALRAMRELDLARPALGVALAGDVTLTLAAKANGGVTKDVTVALTPERPTYGAWPARASGVLSEGKAARVRGGVGYLRIAEMDDALVPSLRARMREFAGTGGLVVDVRGNGGGERGVLLALAGYLIAPGAEPVVANVAAYRLSAKFGEDHLGGSRHLFRADDPRWTDAQRKATQATAARFAPEWALPSGFSAWHYLVLDRTGHPDEYHYTAPVVVLSDAACFSATDIFLAGLAELPGVTSFGLPSGGGSARAETFVLPGTGITVRCASMVSFRADGRLFDGRGVEVDHEVARGARDVLVGGEDAQLDAALDHLRR